MQNITLESHLDAGWADVAMREDVARAFRSQPIILPPKWLYDDRGSELFDQITRLPEYYPTEAERALLIAHAHDIAEQTGADTVIELGSGTSDKTRTLLDAFASTGQLQRFVPFDVSEATLMEAAEMLTERYGGITVEAIAGDFTRHLATLPRGGTRLVAFLGGTVGNFYAEERRAFLGALSDTLDAGDWLLLGVDLFKDVDRIIDAYDDPAGISAMFCKNVLRVMNRELDADFDLDAFSYVAFWDPAESRVDMRLRADTPQSVRIDTLELDVRLEESEEIRVEISTKFRPHTILAEVVEAGFADPQLWTGDGDFGLLLARRS